MEKMRFNQLGQWSIEKVERAKEIKNSSWEDKHAPRGQQPYEGVTTKSVKVGDKQMFHHIFHYGKDKDDVMRHILSEHKDPTKDGVSAVHGNPAKHGNHFVLSGLHTPKEHQGKGYGSTLMHGVIDHHKSVIGDKEEVDAGYNLMNRVAKDPRYNHTPPKEIKHEEYKSLVESGQATKEHHDIAASRRHIWLKNHKLD
jgi:GNAT superfamily N-acetyltransferase